MTAVSSIITTAFREGNITPIGSQPSGAEQTEAVDLLNRLIRSVFGSFAGSPLMDWELPRCQTTNRRVPSNAPLLPGSRRDTTYQLDPRFPPCNARVVWDGTDQTLYFPALPMDGARIAVVANDPAATGTMTLDGNGRGLETSTGSLTASDTPMVWVYRADLARWLQLREVGVGDELPFPGEFDDLWVTGLFIRLAPRFGKQVSPESAQEFLRMKKLFQTQYHQTAPELSGADQLVNTNQSYPTGYSSGWMD